MRNPFEPNEKVEFKTEPIVSENENVMPTRDPKSNSTSETLTESLIESLIEDLRGLSRR